ncbi:MAG: NADH-quinone oxidoreductase subunit H [Rhodanobacteraceae bacterium]
MSAFAWTGQLLGTLLAIALAPLLAGWVAQCRAWLQNRSAPSLLLPYRSLRKLLRKDAALATNASPLFRSAPYLVFGSMTMAAAIIPSVTTDLPMARVADAIALVGLFALARVFIALAAMDIGTVFGSMGARRDMMIGFLAEPALLMVLFNAFLMFGSTALPSVAEGVPLDGNGLVLHPSLAFAGVAFVMVLLAENGRIPIDNPTTHLEVTMIHEAMLLEYSARHLALMEWAAWLKLLNYACIGFVLFMPWGIALHGAGICWLLLAVVLLIAKLALAGAALAAIETVSAKVRLFRAPEFLSMAFLLGVLGLLVNLLLRS